MKKFWVAAVTLLAGGAAVAGAAMQMRNSRGGMRVRKWGTVRVAGKNHPVVFGVKKVSPEPVPTVVRRVGSSVCTSGARYLLRHVGK